MIDKINSLLSRIHPSQNNKIEITDLTDEQTANLLISDYNEAYEAFTLNHCIFRGQNIRFMSAKMRPGLRISQNTYNMYTRLMSDVFSTWKDYPKRNRSFICTNNLKQAKGYSKEGYLYYIFPKNGAKIGICSEYDIWASFPALKEFKIKNITTLNKIIYTYIKYALNLNDLNKVDDIFIYGSPEDILKTLNLVDKFVIEDDGSFYELVEESSVELGSIIYKELKNGKKLASMLENWLNPKNNRFKLTTINSYDLPKTVYWGEYSHELWIDSECLAVEYRKMNSIVSLIESGVN